MIFNIFKDELMSTWHRYHYSVEAETVEEAIEKIKNDEVDNDDFEFIPGDEIPQVVEYLDHEGNLLCKE